VKVLVPADDKEQRNTGPSWQPGGNKIAFASNHSGRGDSDVYVYDMKTEKVIRITDLADSVMFAKFSGDGKSITFSTNLGNVNNDVYSVNADGGKLLI
jgi:Tol biopolymer transport system component